MKKTTLILLASLLVFAGCEREFNQAMKSTDKDKILKTADNFYNKKKYKQAISLYEYAVKFVVGTDEAPEVAYKSAYANYYDKNYRLAAHQFKNFAVSYAKDPRAEEVSYIATQCYYLDSPRYDLDQTNTHDAIRELQNFIDNYPNSDKISECNKQMDELNMKLQKKAFENAKTLYKITEYKAAVVAFDNVLNDYPDTSLKEDISIYGFRSRTELAINSIYALQDERINDAQTAYKNLITLYPDYQQLNEVERLNDRLTNARKKYIETTQTLEELKKTQEAKQAETQAKEEATKQK
ncbi:MAG: outer membrane protein assembly factor BamD [Flavobacteriaceae bacterium]|jgi:outer membrane protein assembly factor BamD|nr:outer membrane protein assembly factor BamD [Flavobacteriaceae bacterium]